MDQDVVRVVVPLVEDTLLAWKMQVKACHSWAVLSDLELQDAEARLSWGDVATVKIV